MVQSRRRKHLFFWRNKGVKEVVEVVVMVTNQFIGSRETVWTRKVVDGLYESVHINIPDFPEGNRMGRVDLGKKQTYLKRDQVMVMVRKEKKLALQWWVWHQNSKPSLKYGLWSEWGSECIVVVQSYLDRKQSLW